MHSSMQTRVLSNSIDPLQYFSLWHCTTVAPLSTHKEAAKRPHTASAHVTAQTAQQTCMLHQNPDYKKICAAYLCCCKRGPHIFLMDAISVLRWHCPSSHHHFWEPYRWSACTTQVMLMDVSGWMTYNK
eukprot:1806663-Amphidinium_carterae.1